MGHGGMELFWVGMWRESTGSHRGLAMGYGGAGQCQVAGIGHIPADHQLGDPVSNSQ
jgi:hypothetical protein